MAERESLRKIIKDDQRRKHAELARSKVDKTNFRREPHHLTYLKRMKELEKTSRDVIKDINTYLKETVKFLEIEGALEEHSTFTIQDTRPRIKCADGFEVSVQASRVHYCLPRIDTEEGVVYEAVELGYPNREEPLIMKYAEDPDEPLYTVYGYVPVEIVNQVIEKHGGIVKSDE